MMIFSMRRRLIQISLLLSPLFLAWAFIIYVSNPIPLGDEWRWMRVLLIPFVEEKITFGDYIFGEYALLAHSHYLTLLALLASYYLLDLNFWLFSIVGFMGFSVGWWLLIRHTIAQTSGELTNAQVFILIALSAAYCNLASDYPWLLVLFEYIYLAMAIGFFCIVNAFIKLHCTRRTFYACFIFVVVFGEAIGVIAVITALVWLFLVAIVERRFWNYFLTPLLVFIGVLALQHWIAGPGIGGTSSLSTSLILLINQPFILIEAFLKSFSSTLLGSNKIFPAMQLIVGSIGCGLVISTVWIYGRMGGYRKSHLPMLLVLYAAVACFSILLSRATTEGADIIDAPRFVRAFSFYYVGASMALVIINPSKQKTFALLFSSVVIVGCMITAIHRLTAAPHIKNYFASSQLSMLVQPFDVAEFEKYQPLCRQGVCQSTVDYLREHQLSIFAND